MSKVEAVKVEREEEVKVRKSRAGKDKAKASDRSYQQIMDLFTLPKSEKVTGRDGKKYEIFHRYGPSGGAYTFDYLFEKLGYSSEMAAAEKDANKRYRSGSRELKEVVRARHSYLRKTLRVRVRSFKTALVSEYNAQSLTPLVSMVRIHSKDDDRKLFIQGWVNEKGELVIGSRDDAALWVIESLHRSEGMARFHAMAHIVGKDLVKKGLTGPIKDRLLEKL